MLALAAPFHPKTREFFMQPLSTDFGALPQHDAAYTAPMTKHSRATIALHWCSVALVLISAAAVLLRELVETPGLRVFLLDLHRQTGTLVLLGLVLRVAVRFTIGLADLSKGMPVILKLAAHMAHLALYGMLLGLPLLGWAVSNAHGVPISLLGLPLPNLVQADSDLADTLTDYHVWAAWGMLALVVAHAAAAWWHHAVRRDGVLTAMLPSVRRQARAGRSGRTGR
jgi:cytochrome b561